MHNGKALKKADPSTIQDKLLVGYQGWFTCAGDGEPGECSTVPWLLSATSVCSVPTDLDLRCISAIGSSIRNNQIVGRGHHGWLHWFNHPIPDGGRPNTDIWPDVSEYDPSELHEAPGLKTQSGEKCFLFSSRNQKTVDRSVLVAPLWNALLNVSVWRFAPDYMRFVGTLIGWHSTV
jgi:hypothetical protein